MDSALLIGKSDNRVHLLEHVYGVEKREVYSVVFHNLEFSDEEVFLLPNRQVMKQPSLLVLGELLRIVRLIYKPALSELVSVMW